MCYGCYEEADKPAIVNEKTIKAAESVQFLYKQEGCLVGGYAHIVTDDWNLDDDDIEFCIKAAETDEYNWKEEEGRLSALDALYLFRDLTLDERYSALALASNYISA